MLGCWFFFNNVRNQELPIPIPWKSEHQRTTSSSSLKNKRTSGSFSLKNIRIKEPPVQVSVSNFFWKNWKRTGQFLASWLSFFIFQNLTKAGSLICLEEKLLWILRTDLITARGLFLFLIITRYWTGPVLVGYSILFHNSGSGFILYFQIIEPPCSSYPKHKTRSPRTISLGHFKSIIYVTATEGPAKKESMSFWVDIRFCFANFENRGHRSELDRAFFFHSNLLEGPRQQGGRPAAEPPWYPSCRF